MSSHRMSGRKLVRRFNLLCVSDYILDDKIFYKQTYFLDCLKVK